MRSTSLQEYPVLLVESASWQIQFDRPVCIQNSGIPKQPQQEKWGGVTWFLLFLPVKNGSILLSQHIFQAHTERNLKIMSLTHDKI